MMNESKVKVHYYEGKERNKCLFTTDGLPVPYFGLVVSWGDDRYQVVEVEWAFLGKEKHLYVDAYVWKLGEKYV